MGRKFVREKGAPGLASSRFNLQELLRPTRLPAIGALLVVMVAGYFADSQNNLVYRQRARTEVLNQVSVIRAKLEGNIAGNLQLVRGLVAAISTEPDMDQVRYHALASRLFQGQTRLRNIAAAPNLVVTMVYPIEGNEAAIGLDYRTNEAQREAVLRAMKSGELVLAGPVELVQGGSGFIGRFPGLCRARRGPQLLGLAFGRHRRGAALFRQRAAGPRAPHPGRDRRQGRAGRAGESSSSGRKACSVTIR